jgi:hypothetical protein
MRPGVPDEPDGPHASMRWHVDRTILIAKIIGIVAFAGVPQVFGLNLLSRWFGGVVAVALAGYALRDVIAPVRLAADADGVRVIHGFAGHLDIPWPEVERVGVDARRRSGFLEIETADSLHLFSRYDLSMPPTEAMAELTKLRTT